MNEESTVLRSDQEYNVNVVKTSVKCSKPRRLHFAEANLFLGRNCVLAIFFACVI